MSSNQHYIREDEYYGNVLSIAPDGTLLGGIASSKAKWYLDRDLAKPAVVPDGYPHFKSAIQLTFQPKKIGQINNDAFRLQEMKNQCVCCAGTEKLSVHHVVPSIIRHAFPAEHKENQRGWCVLICWPHHCDAEEIILKHIGAWRHELTVAMSNRRSLFVRQSAERLFRLRPRFKNGTIDLNKFPREKYEEMAKAINIDMTLEEFAQSDFYIDLKHYRQADRLESKRIRREFAQKFIEQKGGIEKTKEFFRDLFLELNPQYLPIDYLQDHD